MKLRTHTNTQIALRTNLANKIVENCNVTPLVNNLEHMLSVDTDEKQSFIFFIIIIMLGLFYIPKVL